MMIIRTGFGFDVHRLEPGRDLLLGGVLIPHEKGAVGHSDADTLIHALCDALLGAAGLRDIGFHFPDNDPAYRGIDSRILLGRVMQKIAQEGYRLGNADMTVVLQRPKIASHIPAIIASLAAVMRTDAGLLSVKAKTSEGLGFAGREEGIAVYATVLIQKN